MAVVYDPRDPAIRADPYPVFRRLRDDDPVHKSEVLGGWVLTRYDDVKAAITDARLSADRLSPFFAHREKDGAAAGGIVALQRYLNTWMVFRDPPDHTRLRGLANRFFTSAAIDRLAPMIAGMIEELLDRLAAKARDAGAVDLIADFAYPLPASVIMAMLGVPRADLEPVKAWSDDIALFIGGAQATDDKYARAAAGAGAMADYFRALLAERRHAPRDDLVSALARAVETGDLGGDEAIGTSILLLFAGHETTTNLIGNGVRAFLSAPAQWRRLVGEPGLARDAVEEALRFDGPTAALVRIVARPIAIGGARLDEGERVFTLLNAANRDPRQFVEPDRVDIARAHNPHLGFGHGIHFCLGAPLARLEGRLAFAALARRFPRLRLLDDPLEWVDSLVLRGLKALPVALDGGA